jgi:hypothetical protein
MDVIVLGQSPLARFLLRCTAETNPQLLYAYFVHDSVLQLYNCTVGCVSLQEQRFHLLFSSVVLFHVLTSPIL